MVFLSHANPEDDLVTSWLALQLAREGYAVWCDLTKLLGGEAFWDDIQTAIEHRSAKFLYVLSRNSNRKDGALAELTVAPSSVLYLPPRLTVCAFFGSGLTITVPAL